jgi:hypothetical protein
LLRGGSLKKKCPRGISIKRRFRGLSYLSQISVTVIPVNPTYSDRYRFSFNELPAPLFGTWLLIQGIISSGFLPILLGLASIAYTLFKLHRRYDLFEDALVINYLAPRVLPVYLRDIEMVQVVRQPIVGTVVLLQRKVGTKLIIRPNDPQEMASRLNAALSA